MYTAVDTVPHDGSVIEAQGTSERKANREWFLAQTTPEAQAEHVASVLRKCIEYTDIRE
jgi:hypothetical protein